MRLGYLVGSVVALLLCGGFLAAAYLGPAEIYKLLDNGILQQVVVSNYSSLGYPQWQDTRAPNTPPTHMKFYIFNVTNPTEVLNGAIPNLVEFGPYSYMETKVKVNVTFSPDGTLATYYPWEFWVWDPLTTAPGLNPHTDFYTTLNVPFLAIQSTLGDQWWQAMVFDLLASRANSTFFKSMSVHDILFGQKDALLDLLRQLGIPNVPEVVSLNVNQSNASVGNTPESYIQSYTGSNDSALIHQYYKWNGTQYLPFWGSPAANLITGSDAYNFQPNVNKSELLMIFVDTFYRKAHIQYNNDTVVEGITLYSFTIYEPDFFNASQLPENADYYQFGPGGVMNGTAFSQGLPLFLSKPHFLDADPYYLTLVNMSPPVADSHDTFVMIEPTSGIMMCSYKRLQINIVTTADLFLYPNLAKTYFPIFWAEEGGSITADLADQFKSKVYTATRVARYGGIVALVAGGFFFSAFFIFFLIGCELRNPYPAEDDPFDNVGERTKLLRKPA